MCQPRKWFWGLFPLAALWALSLYVLEPQIESELTHRVHTALAKDLPWARTAIEGRDIVIEGAAPTDEAQHHAMKTAVETDGVRLAISNATMMPEVKPFTWEARREANRVVLGGHVAADGSRAVVVEAANKAVAGATVVDEMKDARGAPAGAAAMATAALAQLARLKSGSVALVDNKLAIKGAAHDQASLTALNAAVKSLPHPLQAGLVEVTLPAAGATATPAAGPAVPVAAVAPPPAPAPKAAALPVEQPYRWQAVKTGNQVTMSGSVPSEAARNQSIAAAKSALGGGQVVDQMKHATGLPSGIDFGAATGFAVTQLAQMKSGAAKLTDGALSLEGETLDAAAYRAVAAATSGALPGGVKLEVSTVSPPRIANYAWGARRDDKTLTLTGHYPDEGTRTAMLQGAAQRFGDLKLDDRTSIASGAPDGFSAALGMGLDQLSRLKSGEVSIAGGKLVVAGIAPNGAVAADLKMALSKLVGGIPAEAKVTVVAPPAPPAVPAAPVAAMTPPAAPNAPVIPAPAPSATAGAPATTAKVDAIPDAKKAVPPSATAEAPAKSSSIAAATPAAPPVPVPATPATPPPPAAAKPAAPVASTPAPVAAQPAPAAAAPATAIPPSANTAAAASPTLPAAAPAAPATLASCIADLASAAKSGRIRFQSSRADIRAWSRPALDKAVAALKRCPTLRIEVAGHTDATGSQGFNETLSKTRAEAVAAVLIKSGIAADRLNPAGYAASKPVASNATAVGKAKNRRIEFNVVQ